MKRKDLKVLLLSMIVIGIILLVDDLGLHFLGDLSWMDGYNPYTHHWMVGAGLVAISYWYWRKRKL